MWFFPVAWAEDAADPPAVEIGGFVESYASWNFNQPANGVTAFRGFDARHASPTLSLASLGAGLHHPTARGRLALQVGPTAASVTASEPSTGGGAGVASITRHVARPIREAWAGVGNERLQVDAGLFLSPVGYHAVAAKDNRFWSLSDLGFALPFYLTGALGTWTPDGDTALTVGVLDGYNRLADPDGARTVGVWLRRELGSGAAFQVLYLGGDPSAQGDGRPWRHLADAWLEVTVGPVDLVFCADAGLEHRTDGAHPWLAGELFAVWRIREELEVGLRGDVFSEPGDDRLFLPTARVGSATATFGWLPRAPALVRLEIRHDRATEAIFFGKEDPEVPTRATQTTVTLGVTAWFEGRVPLEGP